MTRRRVYPPVGRRVSAFAWLCSCRRRGRSHRPSAPTPNQPGRESSDGKKWRHSRSSGGGFGLGRFTDRASQTNDKHQHDDRSRFHGIASLTGIGVRTLQSRTSGSPCAARLIRPDEQSPVWFYDTETDSLFPPNVKKCDLSDVRLTAVVRSFRSSFPGHHLVHAKPVMRCDP